jgi:hypothetical protein
MKPWVNLCSEPLQIIESNSFLQQDSVNFGRQKALLEGETTKTAAMGRSFVVPHLRGGTSPKTSQVS